VVPSVVLPNWVLTARDKAAGRVYSFKYFNNVINKEEKMNEFVKDRIHAWNRSYRANHHTLKRDVIRRAVKMQIYKTLIRSVVT
jgi:bisphosphoglycerate-dependent phosphoglycerate mutase